MPWRGLLLAAVTLALGACGQVSVSVGDQGGQTRESTTASPSAGPGRPPSSQPSSPVLPAGLRRDLVRVAEDRARAEVAIALAPVGGGEPVLVGEDPAVVAWSTIKVPLALAALQGRAEVPAGTVDQAISASDNDAAMRLWTGLGEPGKAARAVEEVLRDAGDRRTRVQARQTRAGYSPFGQSVWRVADQARFAAGLPCLPSAEQVTGPMGEVVDGQRWGLGGIEGARYKGGWGPTAKGYVVRQMGVVPVGDGERVAVAMAARVEDYAQGTAVMDELAAALAKHRDEVPGGSCSGKAAQGR